MHTHQEMMITDETGTHHGIRMSNLPCSNRKYEKPGICGLQSAFYHNRWLFMCAMTLMFNPLPGDAAMPGQSIYESSCISCHGASGEGAFPGVVDLTDPRGPLSKPDATLIANMINGVQSEGSPMAMPPKGGNPELSHDDIEAVLRYLRTTFGKQ